MLAIRPLLLTLATVLFVTFVSAAHADENTELKTDRDFIDHAEEWGITSSGVVVMDGWDGDESEKAKILERLEREKKLMGKPKEVTLLRTRHFYLLTDVDRIKVKKDNGGIRKLKNLEWAHLMIERAEVAYQDWVEHLPAPNLPKPIGIYILEKERDRQRFSNAYMRSAGSNLLAGGSDGGPSDGICYNGMCISRQSHSSDHELHMTMRHMLGRLFVSCWKVANANERRLPRWMYVGAGHWLSRYPEKFRDDAAWLGQEGGTVQGSGKDWNDDLAKEARKGKLEPIEKLFGKTAENQLTLLDHKRSWSYWHFTLAEWREPFVKMMGELRDEVPARDAFMKRMQCTPEIFDARWQERVTGSRRSMDPDKHEEGVVAENEDPTEAERRNLKKERDPATIAALVRGLGTLDDPRTAEVLIELLGRKSELVRSSIFVCLMQSGDAEVQEKIWQAGLEHSDPVARAYSARLCGRLNLDDAIPGLRKLLDDSNWFARAEAAYALGLLKDHESMAKMREMVSDSADKARVGAMDALALFGEEGFNAVEPIAANLKASEWQLRVVAAQALGEIGSMAAVEPLIERMELETGRIRKECREALKKITRDDLGRKPEFWREWWERLKVNSPRGLPDRPAPTTGDPEEKKEDPNDRYAKQTYYGIELFSSRIGFVLDVSQSMLVNFTPSKGALKQLGDRQYTGQNKLTICKEEIAYSLKGLDPRAHFNIVAFGTRITTFKKNPVRASSGNVGSGISFLRSLPGQGETNYYDALRAVLDLGDGPDDNPNFRDTPDTLTFLTDGTPTKGEITHGDTLIEWYSGLNRYARIKTHVIAFGNTGVDFKLLRALADRNAGTYVHVPEAN